MYFSASWSVSVSDAHTIHAFLPTELKQIFYWVTQEIRPGFGAQE